MAQKLSKIARMMKVYGCYDMRGKIDVKVVGTYNWSFLMVHSSTTNMFIHDQSRSDKEIIILMSEIENTMQKINILVKS